jgi:hypothetical protein
MTIWFTVSCLILTVIFIFSGGLASKLGVANRRRNRHRWLREQHQLWLDEKRMPMREDAKAAFAATTIAGILE